MTKTVSAAPLFEDIGNQLLCAWEKDSFNEQRFPDLAHQALIKNQLHLTLDTDKLLSWLFSASQIPKQQNLESSFGDCCLTVYTCEHFYIEVLFWLEGTTSIHQHGFSGAFATLKGNSIHTYYDFDLDKKINPSLLLGEVNFKAVEYLYEGSVRKIHPGYDMAHSLFHLNHPNISIVIRTYKSNQVKRQYSYLKPYLAYDPFSKNEQLTCQHNMLQMLVKYDCQLFGDYFESKVIELDLYSHIILLIKNSQALLKTGYLQTALDLLSQREPSLRKKMELTLAQLSRDITIIGWRQKVTDDSLRFFLAILLNTPDRKNAEKLIMSRFPEQDACELICHWLYELVKHGEIESEQLTEDSLPFIQSLVRGLSFDEIIESLCCDFDAIAIQESREQLQSLYHYFINESILSNLFN